jgi:hypothetical protein
MTERPILFSAPMVLAILAGTKTQTRRAVKLPHENRLGVWEPTRFGGPNGGRTATGNTIPEQGGIWHTRTGDHLACPYGQPGDQLWVRETFARIDGQTQPWIETDYKATYKLGDRLGDTLGIKKRWTPSIHMPRHASRISLAITGVRVECLQDISEADAQAEGIGYSERFGGYCIGMAQHFHSHDPLESFLSLWASINGGDSARANPWVWVVEFKRIKP